MRDLLDLDRYPLDQPGTDGWAALVADCRAQLARDGMFNLPGFLHPPVAAATAAALAPRFDTEAFRHEREHNIYFRDEVPGLAPDHPALIRFRTSNDTLCLDQIGDSGVARLYAWPAFAAFLAATMDKPALYLMADPLAGVNVMAYAEGQALNWHFDRSEFTTTLLLQAPVEGGAFIYRTDLRSEADPNHEGVARLLRGEDPAVRSLTLTPGALNVFRGKNTPHRVGDVRGPVRRMIAVFSIFDRPGVEFTAAERIGFYGRAA
jgi:hypothetical protein